MGHCGIVLLFLEPITNFLYEDSTAQQKGKMIFLNNGNASFVTLVGMILVLTAKGYSTDENKGKYLVNLFPGTELFYDKGYVGINLKLRYLLEGK